MSCYKSYTPPTVISSGGNLWNELQCLKKLVYQLINEVTIINNNIGSSRPPIYIPSEQIFSNIYSNSNYDDVHFVLFLNGGRFLVEGVDYDVLDGGGFEITAPDLINVPNDYILIP